MLNTLRLHLEMQEIRTTVFAGLNAEIKELKAAKTGMQIRLEESQKKAKVTELTNAELEIKVNGQRKGINRRDEQIETYKALSKSLQQQIADNRHGYLIARETNLICIGLAKDDPSMLKRAETIQAKRTGKPFSICNWENKNHLATTIVNLNAIHCAKWVITCKNWKQAIPAEFHDYLIGLALESDKNWQ